VSQKTKKFDEWNMRYIYTIVALLILSSKVVFSQADAHFWTYQYGSKGLLLNGAVIASPDGETSPFYNPGSIGMDDDLGFAFSFLTPTYLDLGVTNFLGDGSEVSDKGLDLAPGFLGFRVRPFKNKNFTAGIAKFRRYNSRIRLDDRDVTAVSGFPDLLYRADLDFDRRVSERWIGLAMAYNILEHVGIGLSHFSVWHNQHYFIETGGEILEKDDPNSLNQYWRTKSNYRFNLSPGFITKLGLSFKSREFCFGMTYTSPVYGIIYKRGSYTIEEQILDPVSNVNYSISNRNSTPNVEYKTPHSVGLGVDIHGKKTTISLASEYFFKIEDYNIFNELDDSFDGLGAVENPTQFVVRTSNDAVLNFAVGLQYKYSERSTWVFGFRTDFNQKNELKLNDQPAYLGAAGDVFHISGGNKLRFKNNEFSCGFDVGFGKQTGGQQWIDIGNVSPLNFTDLSQKNNVTSQFYSVMLFITYDFIFARFKKDKE